MTDPHSGPDMLAGEFALGLLTGEELSKARERLVADPEFAAEVARWRGRLAPLHAETDTVAPPQGLWSQIENELRGGATVSATSVNDNQPAPRQKLLVWKSIAGAMTAIAACLALLLVFVPRTKVVEVERPSQVTATPMVAMLASEGAMKVVASWNPSARQLVLAVPGKMATDPEHSNELWVIPVGGKPKSLGTMPSNSQMHMQLADALATLLQQGATIAISVEPRGGSPTGSPTGPVVASGALNRA